MKCARCNYCKKSDLGDPLGDSQCVCSLTNKKVYPSESAPDEECREMKWR